MSVVGEGLRTNERVYRHECFCTWATAFDSSKLKTLKAISNEQWQKLISILNFLCVLLYFILSFKKKIFFKLKVRKRNSLVLDYSPSISLSIYLSIYVFLFIYLTCFCWSLWTCPTFETCLLIKSLKPIPNFLWSMTTVRQKPRLRCDEHSLLQVD